MKQITCDCNVMGYLRYGHYTLNLTEEEYKEFESMSDDEKKDWIKDGVSRYLWTRQNPSWNEFCYNSTLKKWCYLDDILPDEEDGQ